MTVLRLFLLAFLLFTYRAAPAPAPESPALHPPHLEVSDEEGRTIFMTKDMTVFLKEADCPRDRKLDLLYSDMGRKYFTDELKSASNIQTFIDVYNGNIDLLSLIVHYSDWFEELCAKEIIRDLTTEIFCSELIVEEFLEASFILSMNDTLTRLGFGDLMHSASELQRLKGEEECEEVCGGRYKNALCLAFTAMSTFLMDQVIKYENERQKQGE